jgi:hypothetical protein
MLYILFVKDLSDGCLDKHVMLIILFKPSSKRLINDAVLLFTIVHHNTGNMHGSNTYNDTGLLENL